MGPAGTSAHDFLLIASSWWQSRRWVMQQCVIPVREFKRLLEGSLVMNLNQVSLPVGDFDRCVKFYRNMGFVPVVHSPPRYARFECPEGNATFSLHAVEHANGDTGVVVYFECLDLDARVQHLLAAGFAFTQLPTDQHWLWREARLADPSGNELCLFWAGSNRKDPPWRVACDETQASHSLVAEAILR